MTLVIENDLVAPTLTLAVAYFLLSINACRKLMSLHENAAEMNNRKLFVMTCLLTTILRSMTFGRYNILRYSDIEDFSIITPTRHSDVPNYVMTVKCHMRRNRYKKIASLTSLLWSTCTTAWRCSIMQSSILKSERMFYQPMMTLLLLMLSLKKPLWFFWMFLTGAASAHTYFS